MRGCVAGVECECVNCQGRHCGACMNSEVHERCVEDCPVCCGPAGASNTAAVPALYVREAGPRCETCGEESAHASWCTAAEPLVETRPADLATVVDYLVAHWEALSAEERRRTLLRLEARVPGDLRRATAEIAD